MFDSDQVLRRPENAALIAHLEKYHKPSMPAVLTPHQVDQPYYQLGTHPDLVERLWDQLTVLLPVNCRAVIFSSPVLIRPDTGIVFGFAGGTHTYALRLPEPAYKAAVLAGASRVYAYSNEQPLNLEPWGEGWIFCRWHKDEELWCLAAYEHAQNERVSS